MTLYFIIILALIMMAAAVFAVLSKNLITAVLSTGLIGLLASVIYLFVAAPDVAMTEAAIGSGLTTVVFLLALRRIKRLGGPDHD